MEMSSDDMDEEATVESVDDGYYTDEPVKPSEPFGIKYIYSYMLAINPWYYVVILAGLWYLYERYRQRIETRLASWREEREQAAEVAAVKKNPDLYRSRMEAMDAVRRNMQTKYDAEASEAAAKMAEREEERKRAQIEEWENLQQGKGYRNRQKVDEAEFGDGVKRSGTKKNATFKGDYNPLMGNAGGGGYRPSRRSTNTGG